MIRTFHPIGQGAFYSEEFLNFSTVYDCGSNNEKLIKREIRSAFEKDKVIDAVFISHFHADHVNGLNYLLQHCNVRRLFLPLLSADEKIELLVYNAISGDDNQYVKMLVANPTSILPENKDTVISYVPEIDPEEEPVGEPQEINIEEIIDNEDTLPAYAMLTSSQAKEWVFIPFNFQSKIRSSMLNQELQAEGILDNNYNPEELADKFENIWNTKRDKIREIYKKLPDNENVNSMTLYSGPKNGSQFHSSLIPQIPMHASTHIFCDRAGCLYFGDFDAKDSRKWDALDRRYHRYWNNIGTVQIPHHGSSDNYNRGINNRVPMISIISAGFANQHRHPNSSTISNIIADGGYPIIINENVGTRVHQKIS